MRHRATRPAALVVVTVVGCLALTGAARAQVAAPDAEGRSAGLRYLSWGGKPEGRATATAPSTGPRRAPDSILPRRLTPSRTAPRPMLQPAPAVAPVARGLTPASAWLGPPAIPAYAPGSPDPIAYATQEIAGAPAVIAASAAAGPSLPPLPTPSPNQPASQGPASMAAEPAPAPVAADPMAPRRDAPIFRLRQQGQAAAPAPPSSAAASVPTGSPNAAAGQNGARYYSLHRDAGRRPDPAVLPEPVFFDSVALDLAKPPETEVPIRDAQGRRRTAVANDDPSLP